MVRCGDGFTDETQHVLHEFGARSAFPIVARTTSIRIGKARMDNKAVAQGCGEFIPWNDKQGYAKKEAAWGAQVPSRAPAIPKVDFVIPEGAIWPSPGHLRIRIVPEVLAITEYKSPNAISFTGRQEYYRGRAHAMAMSEASLKAYKRPWPHRFWRLTTFR